MKKTVFLLAAILLFNFYFVPLHLASASTVDLSKPVISSDNSSISFQYDAFKSYAKDIFGSVSSMSNRLKARSEAARLYYFYLMLINDKDCSHPIFNICSDGRQDAFSDEYLYYYFRLVVLNTHGNNSFIDSNLGRAFMKEFGFDRDWNAQEMLFVFDPSFSLVSGMGYGVTNSQFDIIFNSSSFLDFTNKNSQSKNPVSYKPFFDYFNTALSQLLLRYKLNHISLGYEHNDISTVAPPVCSSNTFNNYIEEQNQTNSPKNKDIFKQSYRTDSKPLLNAYTNIYQNSITKERLTDLYLYPFYVDPDGTEYYSEYQFHFYLAENDDPNSDVCLKMDVYHYSEGFGFIIDPSVSSVILDEYTTSTIPYSFAFPLHYFTTHWIYFDSLIDFTDFSASNRTWNQVPFSISVQNYLKVYDSSGPVNFPMDFYKDERSDYGYFTCDSLMSRTYTDVDITRIPSNQVITITGNTIYDYSISNPDTGQTSTINNYITNNYSYPSELTTSGSGSGGAGGDINVTGDITVGGQVGVDVTVSVPDININVNQNGGVGGGGALPDTSLVENLPEAPKGFTDYLKILFDFLPAPVLGLIVGGIAAAIFCRVWGR